MPRTRARPRPIAVVVGVLLSALVATDALGLTWASDTAITKAGVGYAYPGSLAASSTTVAHAIYEELVLDSWRVEYRRTTNSGSSWATAIVLSRSSVNAAGVPAIDANGSAVDAVWVEGDRIISTTDSVLVYRRSTDSGATWQSPVELSPIFESAGFPRVAHKPSSSTVAVVWTNQVNGRVYIRVSKNNGASWGSRINLATTSNKPFTGLYDGFPVVAFGSSAIYVGYYSSAGTLRLRRSTDGGTTWKAAQTLATNTTGSWPASIAGNGSTAVLGYEVKTSTDRYAAFRRSTDSGGTWSSAKALEATGGSRSFQPVIVYRGGFHALFERCSTSTCTTSTTYYRSSSTGSTWSTPLIASVRKRSYDAPVGVTVATRVLVLYVDSNSSSNDVYVRRGS